MKVNKHLYITGLLAFSFGLGSLSLINAVPCTEVSAATEQTINDITACKRIPGNNSKTFIRFACNDVVGSYQTTYSGNVYDVYGNSITLDLYQNGGAGTADWVNGGTRLLELKTDSQAFIDALNGSTTFFITNESVFVNGDVSIKFAKQYEFSSIYDGNFMYQEATTTDVSFVIKEAEARLSQTRYRVGISELTGLSAGYNDVFKGKVKDADGNEIEAEITDAHVGSTNAGNRRAYIDLKSAAKDNTFYIYQDAGFADTIGLKNLNLKYAYRISNTSLSFCDGKDNHIYGAPVDSGTSIDQSCEICGHTNSTAIHQITLGSVDKYCQATSGETQTEIAVKIGGCSGYDATAIPEVFRGTAKLNEKDISLKITVTNDVVRLYMYLSNDHEAIETGTIALDATMRFTSADGQLLGFKDSVKISYNTKTHKYRVDPVDYSFKKSTIGNVTLKNWVSYSEGQVVISYFDIALTNGYECLANGSTYRGNAKLNDESISLNVTLIREGDRNKLAFIFSGDKTGKLEISNDNSFELDTLGSSFTTIGNCPDIVSFDEDIALNYDAENNLVNAKNVTLSLSGVGTWAQSLDTSNYNTMCSFDDCSVTGISKDNSEIHPETLLHRGYHFYGKGYDKDNESEVVDVDIWISNFENEDDALQTAVVKTAIYANVSSAGNKVGIKLHKDDIFISAAYNLSLKLDDDYLVKWYVNSSRTTAGKYNNDTVGPTINVDTNNLPSFIEGDEKPTLPVSVNDDVDDIVPIRAQTWEEGALDSNNCLVKGTWTVTLTATDSSGNDAVPVEIQIVVNEKQKETPEDNNDNKENKGCSGNISITCSLVSIISLLALFVLAIRKRIYR